LQRLAATRPHGRQDAELRGSLLALRSIARRVLQLTVEERELAREIETLTRKLAPQLLDQPGVGPHAAAQLVLAGLDRADLVQEGCVGILRALQRFDPGRGVPFPAYAALWVRQALQELRSDFERPAEKLSAIGSRLGISTERVRSPCKGAPPNVHCRLNRKGIEQRHGIECLARAPAITGQLRSKPDIAGRRIGPDSTTSQPSSRVVGERI
jgi:hypothetical protein